MLLRLIVLCCIILVDFSTSESPLREFIIRKDFFNAFKAGQFSVYDRTGKTLKYRIETKYALLHTAKLVAYPSKKVVGRLKGKWNSLVYEATMEINDESSRQVKQGTILQNLQLLGEKYVIDWNKKMLLMENKIGSLTTRFYNEDTDRFLMAQFKKHIESFILPNTYDLQVFCDDVPDAIYLLSLAALDHNILKFSKG